MVYSMYKKQRILSYCSQGLKAPTIVKVIHEEEQLSCTRLGVATFLNKFEETGRLTRRNESDPPSKITTNQGKQQMYHDDETTAMQLHCLLERLWLLHLIEDHSKVQDILRMDLSWQCLLSNNPRH